MRYTVIRSAGNLLGIALATALVACMQPSEGPGDLAAFGGSEERFTISSLIADPCAKACRKDKKDKLIPRPQCPDSLCVNTPAGPRPFDANCDGQVDELVCTPPEPEVEYELLLAGVFGRPIVDGVRIDGMPLSDEYPAYLYLVPSGHTVQIQTMAPPSFPSQGCYALDGISEQCGSLPEMACESIDVDGLYLAERCTFPMAAHLTLESHWELDYARDPSCMVGACRPDVAPNPGATYTLTLVGDFETHPYYIDGDPEPLSGTCEGSDPQICNYAVTAGRDVRLSTTFPPWYPYLTCYEVDGVNRLCDNGDATLVCTPVLDRNSGAYVGERCDVLELNSDLVLGADWVYDYWGQSMRCRGHCE